MKEVGRRGSEELGPLMPQRLHRARLGAKLPVLGSARPPAPSESGSSSALFLGMGWSRKVRDTLRPHSQEVEELRAWPWPEGIDPGQAPVPMAGTSQK